MAVSTLPTQVSPPELSLSEEPPARVSGAEVLALPVYPELPKEQVEYVAKELLAAVGH